MLMFAKFGSFWYIIGLTSIKIKSLLDILKWISAVSPLPCAMSVSFVYLCSTVSVYCLYKGEDVPSWTTCILSYCHVFGQ
jgi:hypothetical protein